MRAALAVGVSLIAAASATAQERCGEASFYAEQAVISPQERCEIEAWALRTGTSALVLSVDGRIAFELTGPRQDQPIHIMSITKAVAALGIGRMMQDGLLTDLDLPLSEVFPEWRQGRKREITLLHVLAHTTGLQNVSNAGLEIEPSPDVVRLALAAELDEAPGAAFRYNNKASNLLAGVVESLTGHRLDDYVRQSILDPLGIPEARWMRDSADNPYVMAGLFLEARALVKVGELVNSQGQWEGESLVSREFLAEALPATGERGAGLNWWPVKGDVFAYQSNGWMGQWLVGIPDRQVVAVRLVDREDAIESGGGSDFPARVLQWAAEGGARALGIAGCAVHIVGSRG